jgi:5-methylcytosine-specific restriction endonuclease McrA
MATIDECCADLDRAETEREARRARKPAKFDRERFYNSRTWKVLRYYALRENRERHGGVITCEVCGSTEGPWWVDHIVPVSVDWSLRLDPGNVQVMDRACNEGKGNRDTVDWRPAA